MTDKWQLYSQAGVDGPEYGVRIRPGYVVTGFTREDAEAVVAWQNAAVSRPVGDILERAKAIVAEYTAHNRSVGLLPDLIAEVERLRSELTTANVQLMAAGEMVCAKDARITELEAELRKTMAARDEWIAIANQERLVRDRLEAQVDQSRTEIVGRIQECQGCMAHGESAYMQRLVAAFLEALGDEGMSDENAREVLERIKDGGKDDRRI